MGGIGISGSIRTKAGWRRRQFRGVTQCGAACASTQRADELAPRPRQHRNRHNEKPDRRGGFHARRVGPPRPAARRHARRRRSGDRARLRRRAWPTRPVHFIVTLGAGSGVDIGARLFADKLSAMWKPAGRSSRTAPAATASLAITSFLGAHDDHTLAGLAGELVHRASLLPRQAALRSEGPDPGRAHLQDGGRRRGAGRARRQFAEGSGGAGAEGAGQAELDDGDRLHRFRLRRLPAQRSA